MDFSLVDSFKSKTFIIDLKLCRVLMEDNELPWIFLVPRRSDITEIYHLSNDESMQLMHEIIAASNVMKKLFNSDKLNVASIGNKVSQLHIHIISRSVCDAFWPETVWGQKTKALTEKQKNDRRDLLVSAFNKDNGVA